MLSKIIFQNRVPRILETGQNPEMTILNWGPKMAFKVFMDFLKLFSKNVNDLYT